MDSELLVSVVIVSWNAKKYLEECLTSLDGKVSKYPMEIIVVDNASNDGSQELVESKFPQVKLIKNAENLGFGRANNIGVRMATGNYIALVNSDVNVLPDCMTKLVDFCESHPDVGMVGPFIIGGDGKQQRSCRGFPSLWNMASRAFALDEIFPRNKWFGGYFLTHWSHNECAPVDILSGCFWMVRKKALDVVGLLDENFFMYGEDMDWSKRFWDNGWPIMFYPDAQAIHYGGASSSNSPIRFFIEKQRADLQYWEKHNKGFVVKLYFIISFIHHSLRVLGYSALYCLRSYNKETSLYKVKREWTCIKWMLTRNEKYLR